MKSAHDMHPKQGGPGDQEGMNVVWCSQGGGFMDEGGHMDEETWGLVRGGHGGTDGDMLVTFVLLVMAALMRVVPYCLRTHSV